MSFLSPRAQTLNEPASASSASDAPEPMGPAGDRESACTKSGGDRRPSRAPKARNRGVATGIGRDAVTVGAPVFREDCAPYALSARHGVSGSPRAGKKLATAAGNGTGRQRPNCHGCKPGAESVAEALHRSELHHNRLLAAMPRADRDHLESRMRSAYVETGTPLFEMGSVPTEVLFPVTAVISLCHVARSGQASTISVVGDEGMAGLDCIMGTRRSAYRAVVGQPGRVIAVRTHTVASQMGVSAEMSRILLDYALACFTETSRTLVCVQRHSLEQRLCGWLLLLTERSRSRELWVTHDLLGEMLGVRRETVTEIAGLMRRRGLIDYRRGRLLVLNRQALSALACNCHASSRHDSNAATDSCDDPRGRPRSAAVGWVRPAHDAVATA